MIDRLSQDLRYAFRRLTQNPGFTLTALLSLTLGIGANAAIFSLVNAVVLRPVPLESPEELVEVYLHQEGFSHSPLSYPDYEDVREATAEVFAEVSTSGLTFTQVDRGEGVDTVSAEMVSGNYFSLLGVGARIGRVFNAEDDLAKGAHPVAVLSHGYWQRTFGADETVVGRRIRLNGKPFTVVGVSQEDYAGNLRAIAPDLFVPLMMADHFQPSDSEEGRLERRHSQFLFTKGRLRPGATLAAVETALAGVTARLHEEDIWQGDNRLLAVPTSDVVINPMIDSVLVPALALGMVVVGLVLLIACANLASFLLARALDRRKEIALRRALGASRRGLIAQLLTETIVLGMLGGVLGICLAVALLRWLVTADLPLPLPLTLDLSLDWRVLGFTLAVSLLAGLFFGLAPALHATRAELASALREEGAGGGGRGRLTTRNVLVAAQLAVSLVLLVLAGLFLRSLQSTQNADPGFGRQPAGLLSLFIPGNRYTEEQAHTFLRQAAERIEQLPGVESVGWIDTLHLNLLNTQTLGINVDGIEPPPDRDAYQIDWARADGGFFEAAGIEILRGRGFRETDTEDAPRVAIISQAMADRFFPGRDPLGLTIQQHNDDEVIQLTVVGIASDVKVRSLGEAPRSFVYAPWTQSLSRYVTLVAQTSIDAERTAREMFSAVRKLDPEAAVTEYKALDRHLAVVRLPAQLGAGLISVFAALALGLAAIGLYGLLSYAVVQRTREVGIRIALGAGPGNVTWLLMRSGLKLVLLGGAVGLGLAALFARGLEGLLFGVRGVDPVTFATVPLALAAVALAALALPARRCSQIDPAKALRSD